MIHLITFCTDDYTVSAKKLCESALKNGCDTAYAYRSEDISDDFKLINKEIFAQPRGCAYWIWKPYVIYKSLLSMPEGEILVYSDAGVEITAPIQNVTDIMQDDIFLFSNGWNHADWCKMDIMALINGASLTKAQTMSGDFYTISDEMAAKKQVQASNIFLRNTEKARRFVKEWLLYCQMSGLIDDSPSKIPNAPTFAENRHDQAVLASLAIRDKIPLHWFPSNTGHHIERGNDQYPEIFRHHRKKNIEHG